MSDDGKTGPGGEDRSGALRRGIDGLALVVDILATTAFAGFFVMVVAQVSYRYLGVSMPFSEELARIFNIYAVFLGAAVAVRAEAHIRIDVIDRLFRHHRLLSSVFQVFYHLAALAFLLVFGSGAVLMAIDNWDVPLATMTWIGSGHVYLAPAAGSGLMILLTLDRLAVTARAFTASGSMR